MSEQSKNELSGWFSTYGIVTAQRILERYRIKLDQEDLMSALKTPANFYHQLLRLPLRHVFNGIILQQVQDYQLYAQKLLIEYLLSGEANKEEDAPGGHARDILEQERKILITFNKNFHDVELEHEKIIASSQAILIKRAEDWHLELVKVVRDLKKYLQSQSLKLPEAIIYRALISLLCNFNFKEDLLNKAGAWHRVKQILGINLNQEIQSSMINKINELSDYLLHSEKNTADFAEQVANLSIRIKQFRVDFYDLILRVNEVIRILPEYRMDTSLDSDNKDSLRFNNDLGND